MKVVWSPRAERDLDDIWEYIAADNVDAADRILERLRTVSDLLADHPHIGRAGRVGDTREFVVTGTPYLLIYRVGPARIDIAYVLRGARKWPP
ncbi:MAG TPA: type II toxin-antitoxin system RelE/ParE family toxin [Rhizomicrobium sp.]